MAKKFLLLVKVEDEFNIKHSSLEEFLERCVQKGLTEEETKLAENIFKSGLKGEALYKEISYSSAQTKRLRKKFKDLFEK